MRASMVILRRLLPLLTPLAVAGCDPRTLDATSDASADTAAGPADASAHPSPDTRHDLGVLSCITAGQIARQCDRTCPAGQYCWDISRHDSYCAGTVCTAPCCSDQDCFNAFSNHPKASRATCGTDHLCDVVHLGLGNFVCL